MEKIKYVCSKCKSENIGWDAWAKWNIEKQKEEIRNVFDQAYRFSCDGETKLEKKEINHE